MTLSLDALFNLLLGVGLLGIGVVRQVPEPGNPAHLQPRGLRSLMGGPAT